MTGDRTAHRTAQGASGAGGGCSCPQTAERHTGPHRPQFQPKRAVCPSYATGAKMRGATIAPVYEGETLYREPVTSAPLTRNTP
jgi:hypothetical protein